MSAQPPNFTFTQTIYPWGQPFEGQDNDWALWDSDALNPITLSFSTGLNVVSIWIPALTGPVTCYAGDTATGTPFYITQGAGSELIPVPTDTVDVTLVGSGGNMYVYWTSLVLDPFRQGVIGNQVTAVTATVPILSSGGTQPNISLQTPLAVIYGGTGTASPVGVVAAPSSGIIVTGSFPDQTLSLDFAGLGVVTAVTASSPLSSTGGTTPNISLAAVVPVSLGGTGQSAPALNAGDGISVTGTIFQPSGGSAWTVSNIGVLSLGDGASNNLTGDIALESTDGSVTITYPGAHSGFGYIDLSAAATGLGKVLPITGGNPSGSLGLAIPAGKYIVQTYASGIDMAEGDSGDVATLTLSTGPMAGCDGSQYTRYLMCADTVTGPTTVTTTLTSTGTTSVNSHYSAVFLVITAFPSP